MEELGDCEVCHYNGVEGGDSTASPTNDALLQGGGAAAAAAAAGDGIGAAKAPTPLNWKKGVVAAVVAAFMLQQVSSSTFAAAPVGPISLTADHVERLELGSGGYNVRTVEAPAATGLVLEVRLCTTLYDCTTVLDDVL